MKTLLLSLSLSLGVCIVSYAQKLPAVQSASVKAPGKVKIDGKLNEWSGMQAANRSINVSYTIANDADNLYLILQATDEQAVKKIIGGNITLTIFRNDKDSVGGGAAVTFPLLATESKNMISRPYISREKQYPPTDPKYADSLRAKINTTIANKCKEIGLKGLVGLPDSAISVYNEEGIKAALNFDERFALNYELVIPLKYLGPDAQAAAVNYEIRLNHVNFVDMTKVMRAANGETVTVVATPRAIMTGINRAEMESDTYLRGRYKLTK